MGSLGHRLPHYHPYEQVRRESRLFASALDLMSRFIGTSRAEYLGRRIGINPLRSWFYYALQAQNDYLPNGLTYFEFGVGWGETLTSYISALKAFCHESEDFYHHDMYLFDSFEGLPSKKDWRDDHPQWGKMVFAHSVEEIRNLLEHDGIDLNKGNVHFVEGYYDKTLTNDLRSSIHRKPSIITIDVDYYSSATTVLEWLRPILVDGTLFYFDNVWSFRGDPHRGELAAINDFNKGGRGALVPYREIGAPTIWDYTYAYISSFEF
jgi:hypothetical protein